ncbi:hypothetical protein MVEN_00392200 [Mycena venus]|uniref:Uncharacterized protein n=1 Tax=Mycena venus TaxID=2733690 RepID=A0A8H6YUT6_9AGAR|nr:hypothetical protein MVEN_00392200 [Mycena venus]
MRIPGRPPFRTQKVAIALALGAGRALGRPPAFRAAAFAAAAFSASCFAALSAALLFVLGAMDGVLMLLGRGFGLTGASAFSADVAEVGTLAFESARAGCGLALGRMDARGAAGRTETLEGRARGGGAAFGVPTPAALAGREGYLALFCPRELAELLRERPGSFGAVGGRTAFAYV